MASTTWVLVANASLAKLYANQGPNTGLAPLRDFEHPSSRLKNSDLVSDRAGHMQSAGLGHGSRQPQTEPKQHEAKLFAQTLARELQAGRTKREYRRAIVVAPPAFMGLLKGALDEPTAEMVSDHFDKDYTRATPKELGDLLSSCLYV